MIFHFKKMFKNTILFTRGEVYVIKRTYIRHWIWRDFVCDFSRNETHRASKFLERSFSKIPSINRRMVGWLVYGIFTTLGTVCNCNSDYNFYFVSFEKVKKFTKIKGSLFIGTFFLINLLFLQSKNQQYFSEFLSNHLNNQISFDLLQLN